MPESSEDHDGYADPMPVAPRALAIALGVVFAGAGGIAVFVAKNQAGTVALLAVAAALLLIGIQGTPLVRLGSKDSSIQLARIHQKARDVIQQAEQMDEPEVAEAVATAVRSTFSIANTGSATANGQEYERRVV